MRFRPAFDPANVSGSALRADSPDDKASVIMKPTASKWKRAKTEATLARYEAMDPDELDPDERNFRALAIRALKIELSLQDKGFVEQDGWMVPSSAQGEKRVRRSSARRKPSSRRTGRSR